MRVHASGEQTEVVNSAFDLFSKIPIQNARKDQMEIELYPITALADNGPIEFLYNGAPNLFIDLSHSTLYLELQIRKGNDALLAADVVGPVNNFLHSMLVVGDLPILPQMYWKKIHYEIH